MKSQARSATLAKPTKTAKMPVVPIVRTKARKAAGRWISEKEFSILFHEGEKDNLHISIIGGRVILVVIFDARSSLGLVRLRVKKASDELNRIFEGLLKKVQVPGAGSPFAEITDDDIDNLFSE